MLEVSEAANRIYLLSDREPRQYALVRTFGAESIAYGIRAHNPLGSNWRTVYERLESDAEIAKAAAAVALDAAGQIPLQVGDHSFLFSATSCCALPEAAVRLGRE